MNDTSQITTTIHIQGDVSNLDKTLEKIEQQLSKLKLPQSLTTGLDDRIVKLKQNLQKLATLTANNLVNQKDMTQVNKLIESIDKQFADLSRKLESEGVATAALKKDAKVLDSLKKAQDEYKNSIAATQKEQAKLNDALDKAKKAQSAATEKRSKKIVSDIDYTRTQEIYKEKKKTSKEAGANLSATREAMEERMASSGGKYTTTSDPNFHKTKEYRAYAEALKIATQAEKELAAARADAEKYTTEELNAQEAQQYTEKVTQAQRALDNFNNSQLKVNEQNAFANLKKEIQSLPNINWQEYGIDISTINSVEDLESALKKVGDVAATNTVNGMQVIKQESANLNNSLNTVRQTAKETGEELDKSVNKSETTQGIVNRIKQFVGWTGAAVAFRKVAQDAISTIKELDKQMTEMAVVTDMRVPDYWEQLPQYTQRANALGVSIKSVYEAATLYYQQGLKTNEVIALSDATLKMMRIAGLNAADATDKMTAALRGFNMELNDTSATNVADVYSKLAAITAADVEEISTAMTKTASIASSANMEFETTAAFLSQIIETTRESAETAGTALKTVIARFQELKKDPSEIGEVDGEIIDANKIETALRSVGVALRDQQGQFRDLDDVFLELSSKWQSLDTNTQRYIATIAAGSRQQSRFIAMMQDYGRTTELVNAANNAAGASNEQFSKTLDSLESKVEKLKNSWHTFTLGLMNNEFIKWAIESLNDIITLINKLTQGWDSFSGGALKLGLVVSALYAGDKALKVFTSSLKGDATIFQSFGEVGRSAINAVKKEFANLKQIMTDNALNNMAQQSKKYTAALENEAKALEELKTTKRSLYEIDKTAEDSAKQAEVLNQKITSLTQAQTKAQKDKVKALKSQANSEKLLNKLNGSNNIKKTTKEVEEYTQMTKNLTQAQNLRRNAESMNIQNSRVIEGLDKKIIDLSEQRTQAANAYAIAQQFTNSQTEVYQTLTTAGVSIDTAAAAAKAGMTHQQVLSYQAQMISMGLAPEEIAQRMTQIATLYAQNTAQTTENKTQSKGIVLRIKALALKIKEVAITIAQTVAQWAYNVAAATGLSLTGALVLIIIALVAAVALLVAGIVLIVKAVKDAKKNSPEGQLKASQEALEKMTKAADAAAESYNNLNDSLSELDDKYKALDDLTVGTQEWRDAVAEVNSQVAELVNTYPELASAVENVNGVLEINKQKQEEVLKQKFQEKQLAANVMLAQKQEVIQKQQEVNFDKLSGKAKIGNNQTQGTNYKTQTQQLAIAIASGEVAKKAGDKPEDKIKNYLKDELGFDDDNNLTKWAKELSDTDVVDKLKDLGNSLSNATKQIDAYSEAMAANAASMMEFSDPNQQSVVSNLMTGELFNLYEDRFSNDLDDIKEDKLKDNADYKKYVQDTYGTGAKIGDKGEIITADQTIDTENAKQGYAQYKATQQLAGGTGDDLKKVADAIKGTAKENALLDKTGKKIKKGDVSGLLGTQIVVKDVAPEIAAEVNRVYRESVTAANQALIKATGKIDEVVAYKINFSDQLTTDAISGLADHLVDVAFTSGDATAVALNENIKSILSTLTDSQIDTFMTTLNSIDWTDKSGILNFASSLEEAGLDVTNDMYNLQDSIIKATNATYKLNFKDLQEKLNGLGQVINNIRTGEQGRTFSEEDYNTVIKAVPTQIGNFVKTLDGNYQYIGSSMDDLRSALEDNTNAILSEKVNQLSASKKLYDFLNENSEFSSGLDQKTGDDLLAMINQVATSVGSKALESLGIKNYSKEFSKLITLSTDELKQLVNDIVIQGKSYSKSEEEKYVNLLATDYQKFSEKGIVSNFLGILKQYQTNNTDEYAKLQLEGITKAIAANAYSIGLSDADVKEFQDSVSRVLTDPSKSIDVNEFLKKFINEPWKETFGELAQLSNITDYYNNQLSSLQETYEELVDSQESNGTELYNNLAQQQAIYKALNNTIKDNIDANNREIASYEERYKYLSTETDPITGQKMAVLNTSQLGDTSEAVAKEYYEEYKKLIENNNSLQNAQKQNLVNIRKNQKKAEEYYNNSISTVRDALIAQRESQIEELSNINDTINSVSDSIVSGMRDVISEDRQQRENAEQLRSIQDKEAQLAYLQATSGSQVEILALQKEIADEQQSYQDSLIDQQIDAMEKANEQAANQREKQINIAQAQFDYWKNNESWTKAKQAVDAAIADPSNKLQTELQALLVATNGNLNPEELSEKLSEFSNGLKFSKSFAEDGFTLGANTTFNENLVSAITNSLPNAIYKAFNKEDTGGNGDGLEGYNANQEDPKDKENYDKYVNAIDSALSNEGLDDIQKEINGDSDLSKDTQGILSEKVESARKQLPVKQKTDYENKISGISSVDRAASLAKEIGEKFNTDETKYIRDDLLQQIGKKQKDLLKNTVHNKDFITPRGAPKIKSDTLTDHIIMIKQDGDWGIPGTEAQQTRVENAQPGQLFIWGGNLHIRGNNPDLGYISKDSAGYDYYYKKLKDTYYDLSWFPNIAFKTGGLADFTGPAWLDGTPSAPELVLNSTDTKNFIQLRDILSEILKPGTTQNTTNNEGDTYIDIDINVDELANDYDVDDVAERVQEIIVRDANYRNVNNVYLNK